MGNVNIPEKDYADYLLDNDSYVGEREEVEQDYLSAEEQYNHEMSVYGDSELK